MVIQHAGRLSLHSYLVDSFRCDPQSGSLPGVKLHLAYAASPPHGVTGGRGLGGRASIHRGILIPDY